MGYEVVVMVDFGALEASFACVLRVKRGVWGALACIEPLQIPGIVDRLPVSSPLGSDSQQ